MGHVSVAGYGWWRMGAGTLLEGGPGGWTRGVGDGRGPVRRARGKGQGGAREGGDSGSTAQANRLDSHSSLLSNEMQPHPHAHSHEHCNPDRRLSILTCHSSSGIHASCR